MKLSELRLSEKWFYLFPPLCALYPVIFLYSNNVQELLLSQICVPVVIALVTSIICWALVSFLMKDPLKAGLITTIFIVVFFTYGILFDWLVSLNLFTVKNRHILPVILYIACLAGYAIYTIKNRDMIKNSAKFITVIIVMLLLLNVVTIFPHELNKISSSSQSIPSIRNASLLNQSGDYPDIYYIILDEYASSSTIADIYGYNNSEFVNRLKDKGFFVTSNSTTSYLASQWSMAASLNMGYNGKKIDAVSFYNAMMKKDNTLQDVTGISNAQAFDRMVHNNVTGFLRTHGYKIIAFDNMAMVYPIALVDADEHYILASSNNQFSDDFFWLLLKNSMMRPFLYIFRSQGQNDDYSKFKLATFNTIRNLKEMPEKEGPKFVFVHFICPHPPFVFDQYGNDVDWTNYLNWQEKQYYLGQYIFISNQIEEIVTKIQSDSKRPTVIIIQSDHGPRGMWGWETYLDIPVTEQAKIFNAYYLPAQDYSGFTNDTSPINSFRLVFNQLFRTNFELIDTS